MKPVRLGTCERQWLWRSRRVSVGKCACTWQVRSYRCMRDCKFSVCCASSRLEFVVLCLASLDFACVHEMLAMHTQMGVGACSVTKPLYLTLGKDARSSLRRRLCIRIRKNEIRSGVRRSLGHSFACTELLTSCILVFVGNILNDGIGGDLRTSGFFWSHDLP